MRQFITLLAAAALLSATGWYVIYKTNPLKICEIHPDPEKQATHYYCKPGFDMPVDTFVDGYNPVDRRVRPTDYHKKQIHRRSRFERGE